MAWTLVTILSRNRVTAVTIRPKQCHQSTNFADRGEGLADPARVQTFAPMKPSLSSSFRRPARTTALGQGYRIPGRGLTLDKNDAVSEQHCHWCHCWPKPVTPRCKVRRRWRRPGGPRRLPITDRKGTLVAIVFSAAETVIALGDGHRPPGRGTILDKNGAVFLDCCH